MKRTLALVLAALLLTTLACQGGANTKVTPNHTSTDTVAIKLRTNRAYSLGVENSRKEVSPTLIPPPRLTPEPTVAPREKVETPVLTTKGVTPPIFEDAGTALPFPVGEEPGQTVEGVWLTFYDCDVEGYCLVTASGETLQKGGRYAACDPNYWPFGTTMTIVGDPNHYEWVCIDTGSAVIGPAHWDLWFYNRAEGEAYLATVGTTVTIKVLDKP